MISRLKLESITFEKATLDDLDEVVRLAQDVYLETYVRPDLHIAADLFSDTHIKTPECFGYFRSLFTNGTVWVARHNNKIIATIAAERTDTFCVVRCFYTNKDYRGLGIGKKLFTLAEHHAGDLPMKVTIVRYTKKPIELYEHWGFKITEGKKVNYTWPNWPKKAQQNMWGVEMTRHP